MLPTVLGHRARPVGRISLFDGTSRASLLAGGFVGWLEGPSIDWSRPEEAPRLRGLLVQAYSSVTRANQVAAEVGLDVTRLRDDVSVFDAWQDIIEQAARRGVLRKLVEFAAEDPTIAAFRPAPRSSHGRSRGRRRGDRRSRSGASTVIPVLAERNHRRHWRPPGRYVDRLFRWRAGRRRIPAIRQAPWPEEVGVLGDRARAGRRGDRYGCIQLRGGRHAGPEPASVAVVVGAHARFRSRPSPTVRGDC